MTTFLPAGTTAAVRRNLTPQAMSALEMARGRSLQEFARSIGVPLAQHQADTLGLERRITAVVANRQAGKSRSVAVLGLHRALEIPGLHVLIVSAGEEAAMRLLGTIRRMALDADPTGAQLASEPTTRVIRLTNGSEIRCVPPTERRIRGWTVDLLIIDEAALVPDDVILSAAIPTTAARPSARIVLVSSPVIAAGVFYRFVADGEDGRVPDVAAFRWRLEDSPWIDSAIVEAARRTMPPARFAAEYEGVFPESGAGLLISRSLIAAAQKRDLPGRHPGAYGVDVARSGADFTVIYRNRGGVVREVARVHGNTTMQTAGQVAQLLRATPAVPAVVDVVGIGAGVVDRLAEQGLRVVPFNAGSKAARPTMFGNRRAEVYWQLRTAFEEGEIDLDPDDHELADELAGLRYETDSKGRVLMEGKDSMRSRGVPSPDRSDAIVMALQAAPRFMPERGQMGEVKRPPPKAERPTDRARARPGEGAALRKRPL